MRRIVALVLLLLLFVHSAAPAQAEPRVALVIGNSSYAVAPLKNPVHDASDMAATLQKLGFEVRLLTDATLQQMEAALQEFHNRLKQGGVGLFYYAGHGVQVAGENYLLPVNAVIQTENDVRFVSLPAGAALAKMEAAGSSLNIVILDACRSNPYARTRSTVQGLAKMAAPTGSLIAYATSPGSVASDGKGRNGVFTRYLLEAIQTPDLSISEVLMRVRQGVVEETERKQVPWEASSLIGQFYFSQSSQQAALGPAESLPAPKLPEPHPTGVYFDDLAGKANAEALAKFRWAAWQKDMAAAVAKAQALEKNPALDAADKAQAWQRVSEVFIEKNPYSDEDTRLRATIQARQEHWAGQAESQAKKQQLAMAPAPLKPPPAPLAASMAAPGELWRDPVTGMAFVWVPGGTFKMGCGPPAKDCLEEEKPAHSVRVGGLWLGKHLTTQGQWQQVMGANPADFKFGDNHPVENVSFNEVKQFIVRLNAQGGARFRLPTEAEWEYAARSGGKAERYAGGDDADRVAWHISNSGGTTHEVGTKAPNGLGLYDMSGNVWQWCEDVYAKDAYGVHPRDNPLQSEGGFGRVNRGGSWFSAQKDVRTVARTSSLPEEHFGNLGFRLVRLP